MKFQGNQVVFIHIPRTAGTYIERKLCEKFKGKRAWPRPNLENLFGLLKIDDSNYYTLQHLTLTEMVNNEFIQQEAGQYIFSIVRHPYERAVSLQRNWFRRAYRNLDLFLDKLLEMELDHYGHQGILTQRPDFNAGNMTQRIEDVRYFVIPQHHYVECSDSDYQVEIIQYHEMEKLNGDLDLQIVFDDQNREPDLTGEQREKIYEIYQQDFERFGFER